MRILLVDPPCFRFAGYYRFYFPLGLTHIAAVLQQEGHEVMIYDAEHDPDCVSWKSTDDVADRMCHYHKAVQDDTHPVWTNFSAFGMNFVPNCSVFPFCPQTRLSSQNGSTCQVILWESSIIAGGEHATVRPQDILRHQFDHVVAGEGELGMLQLVQQVVAGVRPPPFISADLVDTIDTLPMPAIECLRQYQSYRPVDLGLMVTARGCPFRCRFCALATSGA